MRFEFPDQILSSDEFDGLTLMHSVTAHVATLARQALFCELAKILHHYDGVIKSITLHSITLHKDPQGGFWFAEAEAYKGGRASDDDKEAAYDEVGNSCEKLLCGGYMDYIMEGDRHLDLNGHIVTRKSLEIRDPLGRLLAKDAAAAVTDEAMQVRGQRKLRP